jgi:hypothetical protein
MRTLSLVGLLGVASCAAGPSARDLAAARDLARDRARAPELPMPGGDPTAPTWQAWNRPLRAPVTFSLVTLADGRVMQIGGGLNPGKDQGSLEHASELLDPATGIWSLTAALPTHAIGSASVALPDDRVLLLGGQDHRIGLIPHWTRWLGADERPEMDRSMLTAAWTWDARRGWRTTGSLRQARTDAIACVLTDGRVLVAGGFQEMVGPDPSNPGFVTIHQARILSSAEIWSPASGKWSVVRPMQQPRYDATLTALPDGRALVVGGADRGEMRGPLLFPAEAWDPRTDAWVAVAPPIYDRYGHTATLLPDGRVLVVGGSAPLPEGATDRNTSLKTAEVWNPRDNKWQAVSLSRYAHNEHDAILLRDGRVLIAGDVAPAAEVWDPRLDRWSSVRYPTQNAAGGRLALLPDGRVLLVATLGAWIWSP